MLGQHLLWTYAKVLVLKKNNTERATKIATIKLAAIIAAALIKPRQEALKCCYAVIISIILRKNKDSIYKCVCHVLTVLL